MKDAAPLAGSADAPAQSQEVRPHRILVVDDDVAVRHLNAEVLIRSGYHVDVAEDGAVAWDTLQSKNYDLLVLDNNMPNVTGVELLQMLHTARRTVLVIMATSAVPEDEFIRSPWLQPATTLLKPYTFDELLEAVKKVLYPS